MTLLTRKAAVLAALETTYNVAAALNPATDAILVEEPAFEPDVTVLERAFATPDLSPKAHVIGRKLSRMTFTTELRGSGTQHSGLAADAARIGRLFRACGYAQTAMSAAGATRVWNSGVHLNPVTWAVDDAGLTGVDELVSYFVTVTTGGASGTAEVRIDSDHPDETPQTGLTVTAGDAIPVGSFGLEITPVFTGSLVAGQAWHLHVTPKGLKYQPVSEDQESLTIAMYLDGLLHLQTGSLGTFSINATAGDYAKVEWEFTGQFKPVVDSAFPDPTYEDTLPAMVELARLRIDGFGAIVNAFTFEQANDIAVRPDVNSSEGYNGVRITGRNPTGGIDPETTLAADFDAWDRMTRGKIMSFGMRVGTEIGNTVWIQAPAVQYSGLPYQDRDGIRVYDAGLGFKRSSGDDEVVFYFV